MALTAWVLCSFGSLRAAEPPAVAFEPPVAFETGEAGPRDLERADFNNDGFLDVAILTSTGGGKIHFLLGGPGGGLRKDNTLFVAFASGIGSGDFNGDGVLDLAVTQSSKTSADGLCDTPTSIQPSTVVFLGTGGAAARIRARGLPPRHGEPDRRRGGRLQRRRRSRSRRRGQQQVRGEAVPRRGRRDLPCSGSGRRQPWRPDLRPLDDGRHEWRRPSGPGRADRRRGARSSGTARVASPSLRPRSAARSCTSISGCRRLPSAT